jgi:heptosyltransferase II
MNLLLRSPNWLGDAVIGLPTMQALQRSLPQDSRISVLTPGKLADFWKIVPGIEHVLPVDPNLWITADSLKPHSFDTALIFPNSLRTAAEPWLAGIPRRIGFKGHQRRWLLTDIVPKYSRARGLRHQSLDYLDLAATLLGNPNEIENRKSKIENFVPLLPSSAIPRPSSSAYLALCPGAEYGPAKRWPPERFAAAANRIAKEKSLEVVLLGAEGDRNACHEVARSLTVPHRNLAGETSLKEFLASLAHADYVLCNDSGAMHVAALFGRPGAAIFGSTEPRLTGPITDSIAVIREHVPCSPCFLRECPIDFRCMNAVTVDHVLQAALLSSITRN